LTHAQALLSCSRELMAPCGTEEANRNVLVQALEHLRFAAAADRAFIFRNFEDPRQGPAAAVVVVAAAPGVPSDMPAQSISILDTPYPENLAPAGVLPWSGMPGSIPQRLASGRPVGGALAELFAETPEYLARFPVSHATQVFPIFCGDKWWGYVGFDDCQRPRVWEETDVTILRAAAELLGGTLQRWQAEAALSIRERYQGALAQFSRVLLSSPTAPGQEQEILNQALGHLAAGTQAGRAYIARNFDDPEFGFCNGIYAEVCSSGVAPCITNPYNQRIAWSRLPAQWRSAMEAGKPHGGPVAEMFADTPFWRDAFLGQRPPLLSVLTVPIYLSEKWWGFIGFDQTDYARRWTEYEIMLLKTAAEMLGSALLRWQAEAQVIRAHDELEWQVQARTAELAHRLRVERILAQIAARLISTEDPAAAIRRTLPDIGAMVRAGRVVLFHPTQNGVLDAGFPLFLEWCGSGAPLPAGQFESVFRGSPWLVSQLAKYEIVTLATARELPPDAAAFKELLSLDETAALILVPLRARDLPLGLLICANILRRPDDPAHDFETLEVVAGLLTGLLAREVYLRTLEQQVADRTRELSVFLDIGLLVSEERRLTESLELGLVKIIEAIGCGAGSIHTLDPGKSELKLVAAQCLTPQQRTRLEKLTLSGRLAEWLVNPSPPLIIRSRPPDRDLPRALRPAAYPHVLAAQLRVSGEVIGMLSCFARPATELTINRISLAAAFGEQLGVIVQNYRLQQQAKEMAVVTERQRLARELHDAVTQSLYSQTLFTRSALDALEEGRLETTREHLRQLEVNASQALREMRVLLHQMRPLDLAHSTLANAIEERLTLVERRVGIAAYSEIDDALDLDDTTEAALYRVILEALNNTLRHAEASQVDVQLHRTPDGLALFVIDNGRGFDLRDISPGMGLNNIRERAAQLDGELHVDSQPGRGTALLLKVPLPQREREQPDTDRWSRAR
jgi:signal transduction histidine kinase